MLIFIDESGDPGPNVDKGASRIFVAAMVIFKTSEDAAKTQHAIVESKARHVHKLKEFKFNSCSHDMRDLFFSAVAYCDFTVRAIVVKKEVICSPQLISNKESFYEYFVEQMMKHDNEVLSRATVTIDGSVHQAFRRNINATLRNRLPREAIKEIKFKDSKSDPLLQLADMCVGAIARSYRADRGDPDRWRNMIRKHIRDVWEFK